MLNHLAAYARQEHLRYGWRRRTIAWVLDISHPAVPVWERYGKAESVPYVRRSGAGAWPRPACDSLDYLTGRHREAWLEMMSRYARSRVEDEAVATGAALGALAALGPPAGAAKGDLVAVRAHGRFVHGAPGLAAFWDAHLRADLDSGQRGVCVCCGQVEPLARLIPAYIPPHVFGHRGSGDMALAPTGAATGKGARAGQALVGVDCAVAAGAALPALALHPGHRHRTVDGELVLWWTLGGPQVPLGDLLDRPDRGRLADVDASGQVCALVLKPSGAGRIASRWLMHEPAGVVRDRVAAWYGAIAVETGFEDEAQLFSLAALYAQLGTWNKATGTYGRHRDRAPESGLWIAALSGRPAPGYAYAAISACHRDSRVPFGRVALIQAFLPAFDHSSLPATTKE
ncbi:type I-C CRISPR-associated protein Cas8c/Csd1 [Nonomuraea sp. NPDC003707]